MKIGILTFHWATNYGAVLQAYSLQCFLEQNGFEVEIIDYVPNKYILNLKTLFNPRGLKKIKRNWYLFALERRIEKFRKEFLKRSHPYRTLTELKRNPPKADAYIVGSDQVWNPGFTRNGENMYTGSYYLDFGDERVKRIAYAVSSGNVYFPSEIEKFFLPLVQRFNSVSFRESDLQNYFKSFRIFGPVVPDPTILLSRSHFLKLLKYEKRPEKKYGVVFTIRKNPSNQFLEAQKSIFNCEICTLKIERVHLKIIEWLQKIKNSEFVISDSYHAIIFSIIFHKPFFAILLDKNNVGMNSRITTLLGHLDLSNRIVENKQENSDRNLSQVRKEIDWDEVDKKIAIFRKTGEDFLLSALNLN